MTATLLIGRVILALVFAAAAVAKAVDRGRSRDSLSSFGVPGRLVGPAAFLLPLAELCVAALLLPAATAVGAATAACVVLAVFSAAIVRALVRGERPDCNCFGRLHSRPVGKPELVRNALLAAAALAIAVAGPGRSLVEALSTSHPWLLAGGIAIAVAVAAQSWFVFELFRQNGRLLERLGDVEAKLEERPASAPKGLPVGEPAPAVAALDLDGRRRTLTDLLEPGLPILLAFSDPSCGACAPLLPRLADVGVERADELTLVLVTRGPEDAARHYLGDNGFEAVLLQERREIAEALLVPGVPSAVVVASDGRIATPVAMGDRPVRALLRAPVTFDPDAALTVVA